MTNWVHRVSNVNTESKTGDCANCGKVDVYIKQKSWVCLPGKRLGVNVARSRRRYGDLMSTRPANCQVCDKPGNICYDHDHTTGKFRGWLCSGCNLAIGNVYDSSDTLRKLADYLDRAKNET